MARTLRESRGVGQVDLHGHHFSFHFADDGTPPEAGGPGSLHCTVVVSESARLCKGTDSEGNDHYRPYRTQLDQAVNKGGGVLFRELLQAALNDDEQRAIALGLVEG
jgi:hypothetical protein